MKSTRPSRIRWYSSATGSLTLSTMSTPPSVPHASSAVATIVAPGRDELVVGDPRADARRSVWITTS